MSKFIVHRKVFFYNDEAFEPEEASRGRVIATCDSAEGANTARYEADLTSLQGLAGLNVVDFVFHSKQYDSIYKQLSEYYTTEFGQTLSDKYSYNFPKSISRNQAERFLQILGISFHDVVEYPDRSVRAQA